MTSGPALIGTKKELFREIRKEFLSPITLAFFCWLLLTPFWINPAIYLVFRTFIFDPLGIFAWALIVGISAFCLISWATFFDAAARHSKRVRPLIPGAKNGDQDSILKILEMRSTRPKPQRLLIAVAVVTLIVPIMVGLILKNGVNGGMSLVKDHGKLRYSTRQEDVKSILKAMEKKGIFTPMGK